MSIFAIGVVTAIIGDVASHFGCTLGIKDSVTAIVFVALGTSVPGERIQRTVTYDKFLQIKFFLFSLFFLFFFAALVVSKLFFQ